jgi:hypothetical protein
MGWSGRLVVVTSADVQWQSGHGCQGEPWVHNNAQRRARLVGFVRLPLVRLRHSAHRCGSQWWGVVGGKHVGTAREWADLHQQQRQGAKRMQAGNGQCGVGMSWHSWRDSHGEHVHGAGEAGRMGMEAWQAGPMHQQARREGHVEADWWVG